MATVDGGGTLSIAIGSTSSRWIRDRHASEGWIRAGRAVEAP